jgi:hypothetical protein
MHMLASCGLVTTVLIGMTGCSGGEGDFCKVLKSDTATAATVFAPATPGMQDPALAQKQRELLDQIEDPPDDLADDLETWKNYLDKVGENADDPTAAIEARTDEVQAAGDALFDEYTDTCMK